MKGIDISYYQKGLRISEAKRAGYEFVILRGGYTGYSDQRPKKKDSQFDNFYKQCIEQKMPVGVYYYSCANTKQNGIDEALFLYKNCLKGKRFEYPIYIDVENNKWQSNDKDGVTAAVIGFCETLENLGYYVGIYASKIWFNERMRTDKLDAYTKWVAAWGNEKPIFRYPAFDIWQYSDSNKIGKYNVDTNISYKDFTKIIKQSGLNGYAYIVKSGDTLSSIAKKYNTTVEYLVKRNNIPDRDVIYIGQKIYL